VFWVVAIFAFGGWFFVNSLTDRERRVEEVVEGGGEYEKYDYGDLEDKLEPTGETGEGED
jgi:hypothetical protein